jgi:hypothetical protein
LIKTLSDVTFHNVILFSYRIFDDALVNLLLVPRRGAFWLSPLFFAPKIRFGSTTESYQSCGNRRQPATSGHSSPFSSLAPVTGRQAASASRMTDTSGGQCSAFIGIITIVYL